MSDYHVYKVASTKPGMPDFLLMAKDDVEARAVATAGLNSSFAAYRLAYARVNGLAIMDEFYLEPNNAICHKLQKGKDYDSINPINERQFTVKIGNKMYFVSRDTATLVTDYQETVTQNV